MSSSWAFSLALCLSALAVADCRWKPVLSDRMFYQLGKPFNMKTDIRPKINVYVIDGEGASPAVVKAMKAKKLVPVCYISAGSSENYRADFSKLPVDAIGNVLDGWPDENWLDIRSTAVRKLMAARIKMCAAKGFLGIEADNVNGFDNDTGFDLTAEDQLDLNKFLARTAHTNNLAIALKNDVSQINELVREFDFAINEECWAFGECGPYAKFIAQKKPVFNVEYTIANAVFTKVVCPKAKKMGMQSTKMRVQLDAWSIPCAL